MRSESLRRLPQACHGYTPSGASGRATTGNFSMALRPGRFRHLMSAGRIPNRTETISEHEGLKVKCPKCGSKKVSFDPGNVYVVTSKKS